MSDTDFGNSSPYYVQLKERGGSAATRSPSPQHVDMTTSSSSCCAALARRFAAARTWWRGKKKRSWRLRMTLEVSGVAFFLLKVGWAVYLSFVVAGYYGRIESLQRDVDRLNGEVSEYRETIEGLEIEAHWLRSNVTVVEESVEAAKAISIAAVGTARNASAVALAMEDKIVVLRGNITRAQVQLIGFSDDVEAARNAATTATQDVRVLNSTLAELQRNVSVAVDQAEDAAGRSRDAVAAAIKAEDDVRTVLEDVKAANNAVEELKADVLPGIVGNLTSAVWQARNATAVVAEMKDKLRFLQVDLTEAQRRLEGFSGDVEELRKVLPAVVANVSDAIELARNASTVVTSAVAEVDAVRSAGRVINESLSEMESALAVALPHVARASAEARDAIAAASSVVQDVSLLSQNLSSVKEQLAVTSEETRALHSGSEVLNRTMSAISTDVDVFSSQLSDGLGLVHSTLSSLNVSVSGSVLVGKAYYVIYVKVNTDHYYQPAYAYFRNSLRVRALEGSWKDQIFNWPPKEVQPNNGKQWWVGSKLATRASCESDTPLSFGEAIKCSGYPNIPKTGSTIFVRSDGRMLCYRTGR